MSVRPCLLDRLAPTLPRRLGFAHSDLQARPRQASERWAEAGRGRARQQNAGAAALDHDWPWFLHADSRQTAATFSALHDFMATVRRSGASGSAFRSGFGF